MTTVNFLSGFAQALGDGLRANKDRKERDKLAKLHGQMAELQLKQAEKGLQQEGQQGDAIARIMRAAMGSPGTMPGGDGVGPPEGAQPKQSLPELAADVSMMQDFNLAGPGFNEQVKFAHTLEKDRRDADAQARFQESVDGLMGSGGASGGGSPTITVDNKGKISIRSNPRKITHNPEGRAFAGTGERAPESDAPLPMAVAQTMRDSSGNMPIGLTADQALKQGFAPVPSEERARITPTDAAKIASVEKATADVSTAIDLIAPGGVLNEETIALLSVPVFKMGAARDHSCSSRARSKLRYSWRLGQRPERKKFKAPCAATCQPS